MPVDPWVEAVRRDLEAEAAPRASRALQRWPVAMADIDVAGVSCLTARPAEGDVIGDVLYFFGGGYVSGSPEFDLPIVAALACLGSVRVIAPRYVLAPEHPYPAAVGQARAVYDDLNGLLGVAGESAGGGLALTLIGSPRPPRRMALFSPWVDMTPQGLAEAQEDPTLSVADLSQMARTYLQSAPAEAALASPGLAALPEMIPPMMLTTGSQDILRAQVAAFHGLIDRAGGQCELLDVPDMWHVFEAYDEFPEAEDSLRRAAAFLVR